MIQVDYGLKRVTYKYCAGVDWHSRSKQIQWCKETFIKPMTWHYYSHQGAIYFRHKKDLIWFKLRW